MTREEAQEKIWKEARDGFYDKEYHIKRIVDIIYDDFKSQTCENCKYYEQIYYYDLIDASKKYKKMHCIKSHPTWDKYDTCKLFERREK